MHGHHISIAHHLQILFQGSLFQPNHHCHSNITVNEFLKCQIFLVYRINLLKRNGAGRFKKVLDRARTEGYCHKQPDHRQTPSSRGGDEKTSRHNTLLRYMACCEG